MAVGCDGSECDNGDDYDNNVIVDGEKSSREKRDKSVLYRHLFKGNGPNR